MVDVGEQQALLLREAQPGQAQERAALQVEGPAGLGAGQARRLGLARRGGEPGEVDRRQRDGLLRRDPLRGEPVLLDETGAQGLVTADDLAEGGGERRGIEPAAQPHGGGHVVEGALRLQAVEEPEALLGEGEGDPLRRPGLGDEGRHSAPLPLSQSALDLPRQGGEDRRLEQGP